MPPRWLTVTLLVSLVVGIALLVLVKAMLS
jgi:hypothetical protein